MLPNETIVDKVVILKRSRLCSNLIHEIDVVKCFVVALLSQTGEEKTIICCVYIDAIDMPVVSF